MEASERSATGAAAGEACPLCGATRLASRFPRARTLSAPAGAIPASYRITESARRRVGSILHCPNCGLSFLPGAIRRAGRAAYEQGVDPAYLASEEDRLRNARRLLEMFPQRGRLLDVGCAYGLLLRAAREMGFDPRGLEPSAEMAEAARRASGVPVERGFLEDLEPLRFQPFDCVVLSDVIEHLDDPRRGLERVRDLLAPGGRVLVLTPDAGSAVARTFGSRWWGVFDDHNCYFDRRSLARLLADTGFAVERFASFGRRFPLAAWAAKLRTYGGAWGRWSEALVKGLHIDGWPMAVNLGDQMVCLARRRD
ncbi:MAG: class I SAM-dependent methyltransferase [Thermoanaerobaculia bacterium]